MSTSTSSTTRKTEILTPLVLDPQPHRKWRAYGIVPQPTDSLTVRSLGDFRVSTKAAGVLTIPAGFLCDLNSIPRFLWWASTPADFPEAGVVHDWAYRGHLERGVADKVYAELLDALGAGSVRSAGRYMALRMFGWRAYKG